MTVKKRSGDPLGSARCRICGRPIWVSKSLERGIGPDCWKKLQRGEVTLEDEE